MESNKPKTTADIQYKSQKEAEMAWLKETQPPEVLAQINANAWKI